MTEGRSENLEQGFPTSSPFAIYGQEMTAEIYAFKRGRATTYRGDEGVVFTVNGQTHGNLPKRFFSRKAVGMSSLEDSIMVIVDCSRISGRSREDLFMNSRDRLEQGDFLRAIEAELTLILKDHQSLRDLREQRRREDVEKKLEDSKPLVEIMESIIRKSPSVAHLLGRIGPLPDPFKSANDTSAKEFLGKPHPSFFRFRNKDYGEELHRKTARNMRSRIQFETDAVNDYFSRDQYAGKRTLKSRDGGLLNGEIPAYSLNLSDGVATLNLTLPDYTKVGDVFTSLTLILSPKPKRTQWCAFQFQLVRQSRWHLKRRWLVEDRERKTPLEGELAQLKRIGMTTSHSKDLSWSPISYASAAGRIAPPTILTNTSVLMADYEHLAKVETGAVSLRVLRHLAAHDIHLKTELKGTKGETQSDQIQVSTYRHRNPPET